MTYRQLIEKLQSVDPMHLDDKVAVNIYATNDTYLIHNVSITGPDSTNGLDIGHLYFHAVDLIN
jgi:hypothetical protein